MRARPKHGKENDNLYLRIRDVRIQDFSAGPDPVPDPAKSADPVPDPDPPKNPNGA